ncbi:hypothetical protein KAI54_01935 [Candidatus Gracilibacteria bacterium]|nr:hypothetical protein [Candidatus Gracilibacteria bacterium]
MKVATKKMALGQFFTKNNFWLQKHILKFIESAKADTAVDPFAGGGDLLSVAKSIGFKKIIGFDIDESLSWKINDSLFSIPQIKNSIIITNPPYLTNYSAKRKGIYENVAKYFVTCHYDDLYQLAIEKCLENDFGVMIIPETFINSSFPKNRLVSITIIEDQLFFDTETPVCVICFDGKNKLYDEIEIYKKDVLLGNLGHFERMRKVPQKNVFMKFNAPTGQIALRAVDTTNPMRPISFMRTDEIDYDVANIKHSSRLITVIELNIKDNLIEELIKLSNELLTDFRGKSNDVLLSPFKGNKKNGERRRRLDYATARAILESAYEMINPQPQLFNLR